MPREQVRTPLFGVPPLDALVGHPKAGGTLLVRSDPRVDGTPLLTQAAGNTLASGQAVVYATTARSPQNVRDNLEEMGFSVPYDELYFVDAHSGVFTQGEEAAYRVQEPGSIDALLAVIKRAAHDHPDATLIIDSLGHWATSAGSNAVDIAIDDILAISSRFRRAVTTLTRWPPAHDEPIAERFDACLDIIGVGDPISRHSAFRVRHSAWKKEIDGRPRLYDVETPGGVCMHIPKIAIIGPGDAGKTSFVRSVSPSAKSTDRLGTTVALDRGRYQGAGVVAELFGTPGQPRFDALMEPLLDQAVGAVLLVHTTDAADLQRAHDVLQRVRKRGIHIVVAATHQDEDGSPSPEAVLKAFPEISDLPVLPCVATDGTSAKHVLEALIASIQGGAAA